MSENLDNILIQLELRGINTEYSFDFDNISDSILQDIDMLEGEFPKSDWIAKLYANKMEKLTASWVFKLLLIVLIWWKLNFHFGIFFIKYTSIVWYS